jgi:hypothetical protein
MSLVAIMWPRLNRKLRSVALVGIDGSGKSTQVQLLRRFLAEGDKRVVLIHPYGRKLLSFLPGRWPAARAGNRGRHRLQRAGAALEMLDIAAYIWAAYICCGVLALFGGRDVWLVSDRSFDDLLIKYRHLQTFSLPALTRLRRLVPCAQQTIWLQTEPEVAMRRDREFAPDYYRELHATYRLAAREQHWRIVPTSHRSRLAVATDIAGLLSLSRTAARPAEKSHTLWTTPET